MSLHYQDDWLTVYLGDCREVMVRNAQKPLGLGA